MADLTDRLERAWDVLSRWAVPVMMTLAYGLLAVTADTDASGKAWMAAGLVLVLTTWFTFRALTDAAALSRALGVGDTERLLALADRHLARRRRPAARARYLVARGLAQVLRGDHAAALAALDEARPADDLQALAAALRIVARIELGRSGALTGPGDPGEPHQRAVPTSSSPWLTWLADGAIAWRDHRPDAAAPLLARVIADIRAGSALRAIAHLYASRVDDARGDAAAAARHRTAAAALAAPDAAWLRGGTPAARGA